MKNKKSAGRLKRKLRVRIKIRGTTDCPRLSVFKSNRFISAQIIDDANFKTITCATDREVRSETKDKLKKIDRAKLLGKLLAAKALKLKIKQVVFDRNGYKYHGRVKAVAEGAREGGLLL